MKFDTEWSIPVPWGKLVLRRCGALDGQKVLLVHGRQDSSTVFEPILEMLPEHFNYVALDLPGNGLSDAYPLAGILYYFDEFDNATVLDKAPEAQRPFLEFNSQRGLFYPLKACYRPGAAFCPPLARIHFLAAMEQAIDHLKWETFIFMGHSMGSEQGLFYNAIHPGRISKMILLDAVPTLMRMQITDPVEFQKTYYDKHYEQYGRANFYKQCYTHPYALRALRRMRDVVESQGSRLLERNFQVDQPQQPSRAAHDDHVRLMARIEHLRNTDPVGSFNERMRLMLGDPNMAP